MKISPLPPLNSLVAFEAAARHSSFTLASEELCVTQGAVSRQVRLLEEYLGKALFMRSKRSIQLTATGLHYYQAVRSSLDAIATNTAGILQGEGDQQVTVATTNAMASLWLLPKISSFQRDHEHLDIRILVSDQVQDLKHSEFDIALFYTRIAHSDLKVSPLFPEEVFPVCSPDYLTSAGELNRVDQFYGRTLLYLDDPRLDWITWPQWFREVGMEEVIPKNRIKINNYPMLVQAALNGQGIALAWGGLIDDYLKSGELIRPAGKTLKTSARLCLFEPKDQMYPKHSVELFRSWLANNLGLNP